MGTEKRVPERFLAFVYGEVGVRWFSESPETSH